MKDTRIATARPPESRWIRLEVGWQDTEWAVGLSAEARLCWVLLLCHVQAKGLRGTVAKAPLQVLARQWGVGEESIRQMLAVANQYRLVLDDGHTWTMGDPSPFVKDPTAAERVRAYRQRQREAAEAQPDLETAVTLRYATRPIQDQTIQDADAGELATQVLGILRQVPGFARATGATPAMVQQVIDDYAGTPVDWLDLAKLIAAKECELPNMKENSTHAKSPAASLRTYAATEARRVKESQARTERQLDQRSKQRLPEFMGDK